MYRFIHWLHLNFKSSFPFYLKSLTKTILYSSFCIRFSFLWVICFIFQFLVLTILLTVVGELFFSSAIVFWNATISPPQLYVLARKGYLSNLFILVEFSPILFCWRRRLTHSVDDIANLYTIYLTNLDYVTNSTILLVLELNKNITHK